MNEWVMKLALFTINKNPVTKSTWPNDSRLENINSNITVSVF